MVFQASGIVLRTVKYGETSGVVTIYTDRFGMQAYLINGIRSGGKTSKAHLYQSASLLEMQVYHNPLKNLQRVKEAKWKKVYQTLFTDVIKNSIALFMVELFQKSVTGEEQNEPLYNFLEQQFLRLDTATTAESANFPVRFMVSLPAYLGFAIRNNFSATTPFFDLKEGQFTVDNHKTDAEMSELLNQSLSAVLESVGNNKPLALNGEIRRRLLYLLEKYFQYHIDGFSQLKTLRVLEAIVR